MYGEGGAERTLGRYLGSTRQHITLATKFGIPAVPLLERAPWLIYPQRVFARLGRKAWARLDSERRRCVTQSCLERSVRSSLQALRTDWIDILFVHEPLVAEVESLLSLAEYLDRLRREGTIRHFGLAGRAADCIAVAEQSGDLFDVLQVEDSLEGREADLLKEAGLHMQITYGYLRRAAEAAAGADASEVIGKALERNAAGCVLVSSRRPERLRALATLAD